MGRLTAIKANTKDYGIAATGLLVLAALLIHAARPLLQAVDGSSRCGSCECENSEDILGEHLEFVLDC